ncbi:hypothetical protein Cni_G02949 [Canna indica]|uniref:Dilute domain-containing protein n=1 Tax=Canna indica TaxID=4628 RepID=A0AAQ3JSB1_9LILI|nr:hypothetical protein Cni_G02949 [Canna indica]
MAARETGALKEAKDKLEKKVEELTWRLELVEKRMRENHEALIKWLKEFKSFDNKRPATTLFVYKSLFHWHSFEAERTNIFERIIQTIRSSVEVAPRFARSGTIGESPKSILSNNMAKQASNVHWESLVKSLDSTLNILCENYVPSMIIRKTFSQVFSFINVQLFNSLLLRWEFCSFSNAEFVKDGLQDLEQWCSKTIEQVIGTHELWQVLHQKSQNTLEEIRNEICPVLSVPQIYRIGTMFWDDKYDGAKGLSQENDIEDGVTCHQNAIT